MNTGDPTSKGRPAWLPGLGEEGLGLWLPDKITACPVKWELQINNEGFLVKVCPMQYWHPIFCLHDFCKSWQLTSGLLPWEGQGSEAQEKQRGAKAQELDEGEARDVPVSGRFLSCLVSCFLTVTKERAVSSRQQRAGLNCGSDPLVQGDGSPVQPQGGAAPYLCPYFEPTVARVPVLGQLLQSSTTHTHHLPCVQTSQAKSWEDPSPAASQLQEPALGWGLEETLVPVCVFLFIWLGFVF